MGKVGGTLNLAVLPFTGVPVCWHVGIDCFAFFRIWCQCIGLVSTVDEKSGTSSVSSKTVFLSLEKKKLKDKLLEISLNLSFLAKTQIIVSHRTMCNLQCHQSLMHSLWLRKRKVVSMYIAQKMVIYGKPSAKNKIKSDEDVKLPFHFWCTWSKTQSKTSPVIKTRPYLKETSIALSQFSETATKTVQVSDCWPIMLFIPFFRAEKKVLSLQEN